MLFVCCQYLWPQSFCLENEGSINSWCNSILHNREKLLKLGIIQPPLADTKAFFSFFQKWMANPESTLTRWYLISELVKSLLSIWLKKLLLHTHTQKQDLPRLWPCSIINLDLKYSRSDKSSLTWLFYYWRDAGIPGDHPSKPQEFKPIFKHTCAFLLVVQLRGMGFSSAKNNGQLFHFVTPGCEKFKNVATFWLRTGEFLCFSRSIIIHLSGYDSTHRQTRDDSMSTTQPSRTSRVNDFLAIKLK